jgi:hypothetical protein
MRHHSRHIPRTCQQCNRPFMAETYHVRRGNARFCSPRCASDALHIPPADQLWRRVDRSGGPDACWEWQGRNIRDGYGRLCVNRRNIGAHQLAYILTIGPIPEVDDGGEPIFVLHSCDNRLCCNPAHLFLGTNGDNVRDMVAKGRQAAHPGMAVRKLSEPEVRTIRERFAQGGTTKRALAREYGVMAATVTAIVERRSWKHIV